MFELRQSEIHEHGVFATEDILQGSVIGIWCTKDYRKGVRYLYHDGMKDKWYETFLGRYCNHSNSPNTIIQVNDDQLVLLSNGITKDQEIFANYNWATEYIGFNVDTSDFK